MPADPQDECHRLLPARLRRCGQRRVLREPAGGQVRPDRGEVRHAASPAALVLQHDRRGRDREGRRPRRGEGRVRLPRNEVPRPHARRVLRQGVGRRQADRPPEARLPERLRPVRPGRVPPGDRGRRRPGRREGPVRRPGGQGPRRRERRVHRVLPRGLAAGHRPEGAVVRRPAGDQDVQHPPARPGGVHRTLPRLAGPARPPPAGRAAGRQHGYDPAAGARVQRGRVHPGLEADPNAAELAGQLRPRRGGGVDN